MGRILVTGANGYIGQRLIISLLAQGHKVVCLVRDPARLDIKKLLSYDPGLYMPENYTVDEAGLKEENIELIQGDLLQLDSLKPLAEDISVAYYLVHSMSNKNRQDFEIMDALAAKNFLELSRNSNLEQVIYLGGISNDKNLSRHLSSRRNVEMILRGGKFNLTVLRAAIIIGSGSASFEIIRDLVEKLPVMVTPKWLNVKCQPIAIRNVIQYLTGVIGKTETYSKVFDIGGPDVLTYKEMLLGYARVRKLKRWIFTLPVMTPRLSSYWLNLVTSTNYSLARTLVSSLKNEVVCSDNKITSIVSMKLLGYEESIQKTLYKISQDDIPSSWKDAFNLKSNTKTFNLSQKSQIPQHGCLFDLRQIKFDRSIEEVKDNIWRIGGDRGWYYLDWLWKIRGVLDTVLGGVGLRRGRREGSELRAGDSLDFWRVLYASRDEGHLILFAEMKIPGEAWLEFKLEKNSSGQNMLIQKATFRPYGLLGRIYWYALVPIHEILFEGMARRIIGYKPKNFD